ncbi:MAG: divalent-cation tolerance protein CutA [Rhodospirillaceae bacterium]|nr:divalent-cation tolerance protein CutA [Rhodospirillaceae bacterium]
MMQKTIFVYVTTPNIDEALSIGRDLVKDHLVACVNIIDGVRSIYRWKDKIEDEKETVLVMKTVENNIDAVTKKIKSMHSYDCPCVVSMDIVGGNNDFLKWVGEETSLNK